MRKVKEFSRTMPNGDVRKAVVYFHADWEEYFVKFSVNGMAINQATYHTDDRIDAIDTADFFVHKERE